MILAPGAYFGSTLRARLSYTPGNERDLPGGEAHDLALEFHDPQRAIGPIIIPANDYITFVLIMAVLTEIRGSKLELDAGFCPKIVILVVQVLALAVRKCLLQSLDGEAEFAADDPKEKDNALLVGGGMSQATEIDWFTVKL
jgi:hypothetical protein